MGKGKEPGAGFFTWWERARAGRPWGAEWPVSLFSQCCPCELTRDRHGWLGSWGGGAQGIGLGQSDFIAQGPLNVWSLGAGLCPHSGS